MATYEFYMNFGQLRDLLIFKTGMTQTLKDSYQDLGRQHYVYLGRNTHITDA